MPNNNGNNGSFNGHSISHLIGARSKSVTETEVQLPVASLHQLLDKIKQIGATGSLTINYHKGSAAGEVQWRARHLTSEDKNV